MNNLGPGKSHDGSRNMNPEGIGFWALVARHIGDPSVVDR